MARVDPRVRALARQLRLHATEAERVLWSRLRDRRLVAKFRRQHPLGSYVLDFYCASARLAVEVDGEQHGWEEQLAHDARRRLWLADQGIRELRFSNREVLEDTEGVVMRIWDALGRPSP